MAQGRIVYAPFDDIQVTTDADQDIFELGAITNKMKLHGFELTSDAIAAEIVDLRLVRRSTTGDGGAVVEVPANTDQGSITTVVESLGTTPGTIGDIIMAWKWEQLGPLLYLPTPEMQITIDAGAFLCLNLQSALAGTTGWSGWVCFEEI
jgi:hypothetical protein